MFTFEKQNANYLSFGCMTVLLYSGNEVTFNSIETLKSWLKANCQFGHLVLVDLIIAVSSDLNIYSYGI